MIPGPPVSIGVPPSLLCSVTHLASTPTIITHTLFQIIPPFRDIYFYGACLCSYLRPVLLIAVPLTLPYRRSCSFSLVSTAFFTFCSYLGELLLCCFHICRIFQV